MRTPYTKNAASGLANSLMESHLMSWVLHLTPNLCSLIICNRSKLVALAELGLEMIDSDIMR